MAVTEKREYNEYRYGILDFDDWQTSPYWVVIYRMIVGKGANPIVERRFEAFDNVDATADYVSDLRTWSGNSVPADGMETWVAVTLHCDRRKPRKIEETNFQLLTGSTVGATALHKAFKSDYGVHLLGWEDSEWVKDEAPKAAVKARKKPAAKKVAAPVVKPKARPKAKPKATVADAPAVKPKSSALARIRARKAHVA